MMKRIVVYTIMIAIVGGCLIFLLCSFGGSPANTFAYVKGKLVTVVFSTGQGSGFIVKQGDKKYMITNEHVIRSGNGEEPRVMMLNGNVLKLNNCEISRDRDLIRFEVETDSDCWAGAGDVSGVVRGERTRTRGGAEECVGGAEQRGL